MTQAKLNTELYQKMFAEQEKFKDWLRTLTSDKVLDHAYEYTCREDILLSLEYNDLSPRQAMALLKSPTPLADVFKKWEKQETNHMVLWSEDFLMPVSRMMVSMLGQQYPLLPEQQTR